MYGRAIERGGVGVGGMGRFADSSHRQVKKNCFDDVAGEGRYASRWIWG